MKRIKCLPSCLLAASLFVFFLAFSPVPSYGAESQQVVTMSIGQWTRFKRDWTEVLLALDQLESRYNQQEKESEEQKRQSEELRKELTDCRNQLTEALEYSKKAGASLKMAEERLKTARLSLERLKEKTEYLERTNKRLKLQRNLAEAALAGLAGYTVFDKIFG